MTLETGVKALAEAVAVDVKALEDGKVDKELGKGLSDANFTQGEKDKLSGVEVEATKNRADSENADKVHNHTADQVSGLGTAATMDAGTAAGNVMEVGAGGWLGSAYDALDVTDFATPIMATTLFSSTNASNSPSAYNSGIVLRRFSHLQDREDSNILVFDATTDAVWIGGINNQEELKPWRQIHHTGNLLQTTGSSTDFPMSQKATTEAIANIPSVPKSAAYTVTVADKGASIDTSAGVTIPASVFAVGDVIVVTNTSASSISITPEAGVTFRLAGSASTGLRTLAGYGVATFRMASSNVWFASGAGLS